MSDTPRPLVGIKITSVGRVRYLPLADLSQPAPSHGQPVVVASASSLQAYGVVVRAVPEVSERRRHAVDATTTVRVATEDETVDRERMAEREQQAYRFCLMKIRERGLPMKLARAELLPDRSKLLFYFTAEGRVDFRELVRDLAAEFHMRIELRQIGVRDEARMLGGYGPCGRALCCTSYLDTFDPVSIKMAKQQQLSLNPARLSGVCGRLKCCLRYELEHGTAPRTAAPSNGHATGCCQADGAGCPHRDTE